jgi:hypothetical protein
VTGIVARARDLPPPQNTPTKPLGFRPRVDVAWPGRPPVPGSLHAEFIDKLGGDRETADNELHAWYPVVAAHFEGQPIGDDDFRFWRLRFRERVGSTAAPSPGNGQDAAALARKLGPAYTDDWYAGCHHTPKCETGPMHRQQLGIDAAKVKPSDDVSDEDLAPPGMVTNANSGRRG